MQINGVKIQNSIKNITSSKVTKPINNAVSKLDSKTLLSVGAASISGAYLANKSAQKHSKEYTSLKELKLNDTTINKILKAKDSYGNKLFDEERINILSEVSNTEDGAFYLNIIKNIDYIDKLEKHVEPSFEGDMYKYEMHANTPMGETSANFVYMKNSGCTAYNAREYTSDGIPVLVERVADKTLVSEDRKVFFGEETKFVWDKFKKTITTEKYDSAGNLTSVKTTALSDEGAFDNTFIRNYTNDGDKTISNTIAKDYKNGVNINSIEEKTKIRHNINSSVRTYRNPQTGRIETLKMEPSDVEGVYNTTITDDLGNVRKECSAKKDLFGNVSIEKNLESFDGTKTHYVYQASKDEHNVKMHYEIIGKNGEALTTVDRTFNRVSPKLAYSSINGHNYIIETEDDCINVTDKYNNKTTKISMDEFYLYEEDREHKDLLNKMSGDMLLDMHERKYKFSYIEDLNHSSMSPVKKIIESQDDMFTFAHEQGHTKDVISPSDSDFDKSKINEAQNRIINNPYFRKTFKSERRQFRDNFPELEKMYISYFTNTLLRGSEETVAESNALFSTGMPPKTGDCARLYYLQKYFPKTIAAVSKLLNPNSNFYV